VAFTKCLCVCTAVVTLEWFCPFELEMDCLGTYLIFLMYLVWSACAVIASKKILNTSMFSTSWYLGELKALGRYRTKTVLRGKNI